MVLCLLGFRGSGYSPEFVSTMRALQEGLADNPDHPIRLTDGPDLLCKACPNLGPDGCTLGGPNHEAHMRAHDTLVLQRLGFHVDCVYPWSTILRSIQRRIRGEDLSSICTTCPWLPLGVCAESVDELRRPVPPLCNPAPAPETT
jgi:hypothetical protein